MTEKRAFVMINTERGKEEDVLQKLKKIAGVSEAHEIYGVYDIVAEITADSFENIRKIIIKGIRMTAGVRSTLALIVT